MSVISSPVSKPRRWLHLWPLALLLLLASGGALWLWLAAGDDEKYPLAAGS